MRKTPYLKRISRGLGRVFKPLAGSINSIQVDMFEVQLGAALLLQFQLEGTGTVCVLADAGVLGRPRNHVLTKLQALTPDIDRLDLVIGTHYDADHLDGLVPIIEDTKIEIGEVWLPPVANDTEPATPTGMIEDHQLLGYQFAEEDGRRRLGRYLENKMFECETLLDLEEEAGEPVSMPSVQEFFAELPVGELRGGLREGKSYLARRYFDKHIQHANATLDDAGHTHADETIVEPPDPEAMNKQVVLSAVSQMVLQDEVSRVGIKGFLGQRWHASVGAATRDRKHLATLRRSIAKDAINATSLAEVVAALRSTRPKVPILYHIIPEGEPRRFVWRASQRRFVAGKNIRAEGPDISLMGPSDRLVRQHKNRLPVGDHILALAFRTIDLKSISASNQLSYILRFSYEGQGILVSGDAGCVDFNLKPGSRKYHPKLLQAMLPLHVIQVAHHGGNNAHFYRVLQKAGYASQSAPSLLLLSHATDDNHRPSKEFEIFVENVRAEGNDISVLFTCRPQRKKVREFLDVIHPPIGSEAGKSEGDVRVTFDGTKWSVKAHAVQL